MELPLDVVNIIIGEKPETFLCVSKQIHAMVYSHIDSHIVTVRPGVIVYYGIKLFLHDRHDCKFVGVTIPENGLLADICVSPLECCCESTTRSTITNKWVHIFRNNCRINYAVLVRLIRAAATGLRQLPHEFGI